jgi:hypothetical protein
VENTARAWCAAPPAAASCRSPPPSKAWIFEPCTAPHLPQKHCLCCGRPFAWRKKWAKVWDEVKFCPSAVAASARPRIRHRGCRNDGRPHPALGAGRPTAPGHSWFSQVTRRWSMC